MPYRKEIDSRCFLQVAVLPEMKESRVLSVSLTLFNLYCIYSGRGGGAVFCLFICLLIGFPCRMYSFNEYGPCLVLFYFILDPQVSMLTLGLQDVSP